MRTPPAFVDGELILFLGIIGKINEDTLTILDIGIAVQRDQIAFV
jgi:hypothetical protein